MNEKPKDYYRVFAPGLPNFRVMSERLTEAAIGPMAARLWHTVGIKMGGLTGISGLAGLKTRYLQCFQH